MWQCVVAVVKVGVLGFEVTAICDRMRFCFRLWPSLRSSEGSNGKILRVLVEGSNNSC